MEYIKLCSGFGATHTPKNKPLSTVIWGEITALVDCPLDVGKPSQLSPSIIHRWIKDGKSAIQICLGALMVRWKVSDIKACMTDRESNDLKGGPNA